jgi:glycerate 2-kinase
MAHRIQNFDALAMNTARADALSIAEAGYEAINTGAALKRTLRVENDALMVGDRTYPLSKRKIFFVGIGKCAFDAAEAIEEILGDRLGGGIALDVSATGHRNLPKIETYIGTHPLPSALNVTATKRIMEFLSGLTADDLAIMLISGGGSTLLCLPTPPMTYSDESALWSELTAKGASIQEINTVRKHISKARGGGLVFAAYPAHVVSLIISDVPGNDIQFIASGPTVLDSSTAADAQTILARYAVEPSTSVELVETPKEQKFFVQVTNVLFLTNRVALEAMRREATARGYAAEIVDDRFIGEARDVGRMVIKKLHAAPPKTVLLYAGEGTVSLGTKHGEGGRNQEMALSVLDLLQNGELILPFASDGHDNTDHAGAIGDDLTGSHASTLGLSAHEYLQGHRSYDFFKATGDALLTGYTGSNVSDLIIAMKQ